MTSDLTKKQMCVRLRSGVEIWIDEDKSAMVIDYLDKQRTGFARIEGNLVNLVEIEGVFKPDVLEDLKRRKMGQWKCKKGNWHNKDEDCNCGQKYPNWTGGRPNE